MKTRSGSIEKHHRFVSYLRVFFPLLGGGLIFLILIWPQVVRQTDSFVSSLKKNVISQNSRARIDMKRVQFFSEDKKGQPFTLQSEKILETDTENHIVKLDSPKGEMTLNSGIKLFSNSPNALFYQTTEQISFQDTLDIQSDNGYLAKLSGVFVDYKNQSAYSMEPVHIRGERLDLDALGIHMRQNGQEVDFKGQSKVILKDTEKGKDLIITSTDGLEVRQDTQTITAIKDVVADDGDNLVKSNIMTAYFRSLGENKYKLKAVQAQNNVEIHTKMEIITGNDAFYDLKKEKAFITGNVIVRRNGVNMSGDRAIIDMNTGYSQLEKGSSVSKKTQRVKGVVLPKSIKEKK